MQFRSYGGSVVCGDSVARGFGRVWIRSVGGDVVCVGQSESRLYLSVDEHIDIQGRLGLIDPKIDIDIDGFIEDMEFLQAAIAAGIESLAYQGDIVPDNGPIAKWAVTLLHLLEYLGQSLS